MTLKEVVLYAGLTVLTGNDSLETDIAGGYSGDIMSDALASLRSGTVWITSQANSNMVAVAAFRKVAAVILPKDVTANPDTISLAQREGVTVLSSPHSAFQTIGMVYAILAAQQSQQIRLQ